MKSLFATIRTMWVAILLGGVGAFLSMPISWAQPDGQKTSPVPMLYTSPLAFIHSIAKAQSIPPSPVPVSGITVPHHLLAADLIAEGFARVVGHKYTRIIVLSPNHFGRGDVPFAVPFERDFASSLGLVPLDRQGVKELLHNPLVMQSSLFSHEHGVQALLPFIAQHFPDVPVLPVSLRTRARKAEWDSLAASLAPLCTPETLIIQSTDFSHYLSWEESIQKDQETLRILASGQADKVQELHEPNHLDSRAAQYLQMKLQKEIYKASPTVVGNANACQYIPEVLAGVMHPPQETTSYIVQIYSPTPLGVSRNHPPGTRYLVAGDFFTGRFVKKALSAPGVAEKLTHAVLAATGRDPLIVNFEGVLQDQCPELTPDELRTTRGGIAPQGVRLCMETHPTLTLMKQLNIVAVSLANNHTHDFGQVAAKKTKNTLEAAGIAALAQNEIRTFPKFSLAAFTDIENTGTPKAHILQQRDLAPLKNTPKQLIVLLHCGAEFSLASHPRERALTTALQEQGASIIACSHPHVAGQVTATLSSFVSWSLGNFLFDQLRSNAGGALLELVFFEQGTLWAAQHPIGNLYQLMQQTSE